MLSPDIVRPYQILEQAPGLVRLHCRKPFMGVFVLACVVAIILYFIMPGEYFLIIFSFVLIIALFRLIYSLQPTDVVLRPRTIELHYHGIFGRNRDELFREGDIKEIKCAPYHAHSSIASVQLVKPGGKAITFFAGARDSMSQASEHSDVIAREVASITGFPVTTFRST